MPRCNLEDLDGVTAMPSLKELYLAYNDVTDLSPLSMMTNLEILDLEGWGFLVSDWKLTMSVCLEDISNVWYMYLYTILYPGLLKLYQITCILLLNALHKYICTHNMNVYMYVYGVGVCKSINAYADTHM